MTKQLCTKLLAPFLLLGLFIVLPVQQVQASLLTYEFHGTLADGSFMDLGGGQIDLSGASFVLTGNTINDNDVGLGGTVGDGLGQFAATSTYDFGGLGSFSTDVGGELYTQFGSATSVFQVGMIDAGLTAGFVPFFAAVAGDPDFGVPLGAMVVPPGSTFGASPYVLTNSGNDVLTMFYDENSINYLNVTATPEPTTLMIWSGLGLGLAFSGRRRRRVKA